MYDLKMAEELKEHLMGLQRETEKTCKKVHDLILVVANGISQNLFTWRGLKATYVKWV